MYTELKPLIRYVLPLLTVIAVSCSDGKICSLEQIEAVEMCPKTALGNPKQIQAEGIEGARDLLALDSYLLVARSAPRFFVAIDKESGLRKGAFLNRGNAAGEVVWPVSFSRTRLSRDTDDRVILSLPDGKGNWIRLDVLESVRQSQAVMLEAFSLPPSFQMTTVELEDGVFLGTILSGDETRLERSIQDTSGHKEIPRPLEQLNSAVLTHSGDGFSFNVLSNYYGYNPKMGRMVEVSTFLNTIHLYDLSGTVSKTMFFGRRPQSYDTFGLKLLSAKESFLGLRCYPESFAILNGDGKTVFVFDWEGRMTHQFSLPRKCSSFDFDLQSGRLFTLDRDAEEILGYDVSAYGKEFASGKRF